MLISNPEGHYRFLKGIEPYSCGVVADPGWEIVHVTPAQYVEWRDGFDVIEQHLHRSGLKRSALCAMELRSPAPFSMEGFVDYNRDYRAVLEQWQLLVGGVNPVARTNVAPVVDPPQTVCVHAFSCVRPNAAIQRPTFVVAGAGELRDGILDSKGITRRGESSSGALLEKAAYVLHVMETRLQKLGVKWRDVTHTNVYTAHPVDDSLRALLLRRMGPAARHGFIWHVTRPPVVEIEFEMDVRGVATSLHL